MSVFDTPLSDLTLVDETALDKEFDKLTDFDADKDWGDLRFTSEQLDKMSNHMLRKLAQHADTSAVSGRSTKLEIKSYFCVQRSLSEYE
jgi:hypothetical protein